MQHAAFAQTPSWPLCLMPKMPSQQGRPAVTLCVGLEDDLRFNDGIFERVIRDYNFNDLAI